MKASRRVFARSNYFISFNEINFKITLKICPDCGNDFVLYIHIDGDVKKNFTVLTLQHKVTMTTIFYIIR